MHLQMFLAYNQQFAIQFYLNSEQKPTVNVILIIIVNFMMAQSEPNKQRPLYLVQTDSKINLEHFIYVCLQNDIPRNFR